MSDAPLDEPPNDGRDGPAFLLMASRWFLAAAVMLVLPRQWVSAGLALIVGLSLLIAHRRRERRSRHS